MSRLAALIFLVITGYFVARYIQRLLKQAFPIKDHYRQNHAWEQINEEDDYRTVLGITEVDTPETVRKKYKELLAKYHPDKVQHLGVEFQEIAENKTRAIVAAYDLYRKKNNL